SHRPRRRLSADRRALGARHSRCRRQHACERAMRSYDWAVTLHAVFATLGVGPVLAVVLCARSDTAAARTDLRRLLWWTSLGLVALLVSGGVALRLGAGRAFVHMWWFRVSVALFLVLGALVGRTRRALRKTDASLRDVQRMGWLMCALVAVIVFLMKAKPC